MMLTVQIAIGVAAGILLAYLMIFRTREVATGAARAIQFLAATAAFGALIWAVTLTAHSVWANSAWLLSALKWIGGLSVVLVWFGLAGLSGFGLRSLYYRLRGKPYPKTRSKAGEDGPLLKWAAVNVVLVVLATAGLSYISPADWMNDVARFSEVNGMADGLPMLLFGVTLLWPFPILALIARAPGKAATEPTVARPDAH